MSQDPIADPVHGKEQVKEASFTDLTDDPIMNILKCTDSRSRQNLRVKYDLKEFQFRIKPDRNPTLMMLSWGDSFRQREGRPPLSIPLTNNDSIVDGLSRLALNAHVQKIEVRAYSSCTESDFRVIDALFKFNADELLLSAPLEYFPSIEHLPSVASLSQKFRKVDIYRNSNDYITVPEMCNIYMSMHEENCKLEFFRRTGMNTTREFLKEGFGVTMEQCGYQYDEMRGDARYMSYNRIFRSSNESVELYTDGYTASSVLYHFDGDLCTEISLLNNEITCTRHKDGAKPEENLKKLKMNHGYKNWTL